MPSEVALKMEYIQKLFLDVQDYTQRNADLEDLIAFLDSIPPEFRSVGYESASMALGVLDLSNGTGLNMWNNFYTRSREAHSFHLDIGLGWAFAKAETFPAPGMESLPPLTRWMVFDGIGYYYGLFRGRRTVKNHSIPDGIDDQDLPGYDQGIGRRLWYIGKGEVDKVVQLLQSFPSSRHPDLWRGVGIACGYVGGTRPEGLELLLSASGEYRQQLSSGIALAAISRIASGSETEDIATACRVLCEMSIDQLTGYKSKIADQKNPEVVFRHWFKQLESGFA